jgi:hypothetical protein
MVVGVFSVRRRPEIDESDYAQLNDRMWSIVSGRRDFGLIGITGYRSPDGRSLAMAFFKDRPGMLRWKSEVEHAAAQQRGRDDFFLDYWGFVAEMTDAYEFDVESGRREVPLDSEWLPPGFEGPG